MSTTTLSTRLTGDELALLDSLATGAGQDRATIMKSILRRGMAELRLSQAVDAYRNETVTLSRAAEIAGLSQWDILARLEVAQVDLHYRAADLAEALHQNLGVGAPICKVVR